MEAFFIKVALDETLPPSDPASLGIPLTPTEIDVINNCRPADDSLKEFLACLAKYIASLKP